MDEVLKKMADAGGIEYTGGETPPPPLTVRADLLGNLVLDWQRDELQMQVNSIERGKRSLDCYLSIRDLSNGGKWLCAPVRINLFSSSAKTQLRRELNDRKPLDWATRLDDAVIEVNKAASQQRDVRILKARTDSVEQDWLAGPLIERNQHTMLVAEGGSGKSLLGLAICASLATSKPLIPGLTFGDLDGEVLYLDWETDYATHERRLTQIVNGGEWPKVHYMRMHMPFVEEVQYVYEYVVKNRVKFVLIDSIGMAVSGDMNSQQDAIAYTSAVRALGEVTALSVTHPGWGDTKRSTGSRYFENVARSVWRIEKQQEEGEMRSHLDLVNYKANNGVIQKAFGLDVNFDGGNISYSSAEVTGTAKSAPQQVLDCLTGIPGSLGLQAIYDDCPDVPKATIRKACADLVKRGVIESTGTGEYRMLPPEEGNKKVTGGDVTQSTPKGVTSEVTNNPQKMWWEDKEETDLEF